METTPKTEIMKTKKANKKKSCLFKIKIVVVELSNRDIIMNNTPLLVRKARFKDRIQMDQCNRRNLTENYDLLFWEEHLYAHPYWSRVLETTTMPKQIVGYILCDGKTILSLALDEPYRHYGWGTKLLQELQTICSTLNLQVRKTNLVAQSLYLKMGFCMGNELKDYYSNPTEDGFTMTWNKN